MSDCGTLEIIVEFVLSPAGEGQRDGDASEKQLSDLHWRAECCLEGAACRAHVNLLGRQSVPWEGTGCSRLQRWLSMLAA